MRRFKFIYVLLLVTTETLGQVLFLSVKTKFFEKHNEYNEYFHILTQQVYYFGTVKMVFCSPFYLFFYLSLKDNVSRSSIAIQHSMIFLSVSLLSIFFPWTMVSDWKDLFFLTLLAFISAFVFTGRYKIQKTGN